jgi:predicted negative regulator of RcsB-dependent stress response
MEETLNKTDLGHVLYEKRKLLVTVMIALFVAVIAWMSVSSIKTAQEKKSSQLVFDFQNETWSKAKAGTLSVDELMTKFKALDEVAKSSAAMLPLSLEMSKFLVEKDAHQQALSLLEEVNPSHELSKFFIVHQRAVLLEKVGKIDEAIKVITDAKKSNELLMPAHIELELGRLYLVKKDFTQAKSIFEEIINKYGNDEEAKTAKLYLGEIK